MLSGTTSHRRVPGASETCLCSQSCSTGSSRFLDRICVGFLWHIQYTCMIMHALWHTPLTEKMRQWINEMFLTFSNETFIFFPLLDPEAAREHAVNQFEAWGNAGKWIQYCLRGSRAIEMQELLQMPCWHGKSQRQGYNAAQSITAAYFEQTIPENLD